MRSDRFQVPQTNTLVQCIAQPIQLPCTSKLEDMQRGQIAFLTLPDFGIFSHLIDWCPELDMASKRINNVDTRS